MELLRKINEIYKQYRLKYDKQTVECALKNIDAVVYNRKINDIECVCFLLDRMEKYSGGRTSILRIGTGLCELGYKVKYVLLNNQNLEDAHRQAIINLKNVSGEFVKYKEFVSSENTVVIATASNTVFYLPFFEGYKMYFVQDYEPTFFPLGDRYLIAKKTYELGYHIVSLGKWNLKKIKSECQIKDEKLDYVDFPCSLEEYPFKKRNYKEISTKKKIKVAAYIKEVGRRLPLITQGLLTNLKARFEEEGIDIEIIYYGESKSFKCDGGRNVGKLNKQQLRELYYNVDFGFVASYSNVSLVPYEMISTGLPVIEIKDGSFKDFFPEDCAILVDVSVDDIYKKIKYYLNHYNDLEEMACRARKYITTLDWKNTINQFAEIIEGVKDDKK